MNKYLVTGVITMGAVVLVGAGCVPGEKKMMEDTKVVPENTMMEKDAMVSPEMKKDEMVKNEMMKDEMNKEAMMLDDQKMEEKAMQKSAGQYMAYDASKLAMAAQGPVVLFFHAPWCPTCKAADTDINANVAAIPAGTTILKVDYDTNPELKKKYGVTYQHTFVQVNAEGTMIKKWSGGNTLASITAQIK